ncbi:MAG TPA: RNA polymerase sigma factor RpoD/SigA [Gemmatimonadales bacterium]|nr:RNA polymerase sigma factor RpoD/SigA [Gemmatimonadales bacterium]
MEFAPFTRDFYIAPFQNSPSVRHQTATRTVGVPRMARSSGSKAKAFFRTNPSGAFDQYLQDIQKLPLIKDPAEERRLARRVQRGDEKAAERLVTANLRFVISYVKKYQGHGLDLSELVAIGNEGLLKAVKKFDPDQGVKFISYAVWWVRQAVLKALAEQTRSVRIPLNQNSQLIRMSRTETYLSQELGREPTDDEIAKALEDTVDNVRTARRMTAAELSLDAPVDRTDKDAATLGERFAGQESGEIEEHTDGKLMREFVDRIFQKYLTPRERKILYLYYGLEEGSEAMTLEKIGALMGVTRERIRQIRERAFEKLRESPDGRALRGFWRAA